MIVKQGRKSVIVITPPRIPVIGENFSVYSKKTEMVGRIIDVEHDITDTTSGQEYTVVITLDDR